MKLWLKIAGLLIGFVVFASVIIGIAVAIATTSMPNGVATITPHKKEKPVRPSDTIDYNQKAVPSIGVSFDNENTYTDTKGTTYTVLDSTALSPKPSVEHKRLWHMLVDVIGKREATMRFVSFEVFDDSESDMYASVWRNSEDESKWHMNINIAFVDSDDGLIDTIIHEFGHTIFLSDNQVAYVDGACPVFEFSEGCVKQDAYVNAFQKKFWSRYTDAPKPDDTDAKKADALYAKHPSHFVSDYAATNVNEDMAESWAHFVRNEEPTGDTLWEQKVRFFYDYPYLVNTRDILRENMKKLSL